jgi:Bacterial Ig domain
MKRAPLLWMTLIALPAAAAAHTSAFKSPGPGMHFTQGKPIVVFADLFDSRNGKGFIICPAGQTISNTSPPPAYSDPPRVAQCSGGGTPTGWPQFQILIDAVGQVDVVTGQQTIANTISFNHDLNPDPIGYFRFAAPSASLTPGAHQLVVRGFFSADAVDVTTKDSLPITIFIDAPPAKSTVTLSADVIGTVSWDNVIVEGNGHAVTASGSLLIRNSLVTGLGGFGGSVTDATIEGSIFEDTGPINLTVGSGTVSIKNNEFRANNRLTFEASNPSVPFMITLRGSGANLKLFQGNRVGAGQTSFGGQNWLVGGDTDAQSNVFIGPRSVLNMGASGSVVRGNYSHHNYRGAWSQGFNFYYLGAGSDVLTEHNFIRDSSWPLQYLAGEFRYNVVYGYGHTWLRTAAPNATLHHNVFTPGGDGGLDAGLECYGGETGLRIYNNTFDGGGSAIGDFAKATVGMSGGAQVASFRNNLVTFSRNMSDGSSGTARVTGGSTAYLYADYNAFYSPDNGNKTNYDFAAGAHDPSDAPSGQLASDPFAGARIMTDAERNIDPIIDEGAIWQGTQKVSQVLALFRDRYTPQAASPVIDAGDPQDDDSSGRRADIGAIDLAGHDQDKLGKFGTPPSELVPPTVSLTAPSPSAVLTGNVTLAATAADNAGGSGVVLVQFLVDGDVVGQAAMSPYSISFNSAVVVNGQHAFSARAWDAAGNSAFSSAVTASTQNVGPPPGGGGGPSGGGTAPGRVVGGCSGAAAPLSPSPLALLAVSAWIWIAARRHQPRSGAGRGSSARLASPPPVRDAPR